MNMDYSSWTPMNEVSEDLKQIASEDKQESTYRVDDDMDSNESCANSNDYVDNNVIENPLVQNVKSTYCHCDPKDIAFAAGDSKKASYKQCSKCNKKKYVDPWWVINDVEDVTGVREKMLQFIKYHNPTKTFPCKEGGTDHAFEPLQRDRFGIVSSVKCVNCKEEMSLEMNTANSHKLTMVEKADVLEPGDEIAFRRWYGLSHHAIFLQKKELEETADGCCSTKFCRISDETIEVVSHTFDEKDARVIQSYEWLQGGVDVYRVEYDHCYPLKWTEMIAMRAAQVAEYNKLSDKKSVSKYDPLLDNCEHFARRCKTGQSESVQVKDCLRNCGFHIAMLVLRVAILATWWIAEATIKDNEFMETATVSLPQNTQYSFLETLGIAQVTTNDTKLKETSTVGFSPYPQYRFLKILGISQVMINENELNNTSTVDLPPYLQYNFEKPWLFAQVTINDKEFKKNPMIGLSQNAQRNLRETLGIAQVMINKRELKETSTVGMTQDGPNHLTAYDLELMEVTLAMSLCLLFLTLKVIFSSIYECRKLRRRRDPISDNGSSAISIGSCGKSCSECCCKCYPRPAFRYLCRMLFCLMPIRLCKHFCCTGCFNGRCHGLFLWFCCSQYVVIVIRVLVSEVIAIGIPISFFATFAMYCNFEAFKRNSVIRAAYGFLFTFPLVLIFSTIHSCISYALGRSIGWFCRRCCCCCRHQSDNGGSSDA